MAADPRDLAITVRERLDAQIVALRDDLRLDAQVRLRDMAAAYIKAKDKMLALRAQFGEAIAEQRNELERSLLSAPGSGSLTAEGRIARDASYRDALERAERCADDKELLGLLDRAHRVGDDALERACLVLATEQVAGEPQLDGMPSPFGRVVDRFIELNPDTADDVRTLQGFDAEVKSARFKLANFQFAFQISPPRELSAIADWQIQELASKATI
jgi:hypothetical protein